MMLVSSSCDVFIRPGQLQVVLANNVIVHIQTQKTNPIPPLNGRYGHFGSIFFFGKLIIFMQLESRNRPSPTIVVTSQTIITTVGNVHAAHNEKG